MIRDILEHPSAIIYIPQLEHMLTCLDTMKKYVVIPKSLYIYGYGGFLKWAYP